jgi:endonuclease YncB( thermonuclease family)
MLIAFAAIGLGPAARPVAADVDGNTYTSPNFPIEITWSDSWFVTETEATAEGDFLGLTNGLSYAYVMSVYDPSSTLEAAFGGVIAGIRMDETVSNFQPFVDSTGQTIREIDEEHALAAFRFTQTFADGSTEELIAYVEVRFIVPGVSVVAFIAYTTLDAFAAERAALDGVRESIVITTDPPAVPSGEDAPVFVTDEWRVAVVAVARNESIEGAGLPPKSGKEWIVVLVDVTNWSNADSTFGARDIALDFEEATKPVKVAPHSIKSTATHLGFSPLSDELTLDILLGKTERVALVYSIPQGAESLELLADDSALPLADEPSATLDLSAVPDMTGPPEVTAGVIESSSDGRTMRLLLEGREQSQRIRLLGVTPPAVDACYEHEAERLLDSLVGADVLVEVDDALTEAETPFRYVWLVNDDGTRTLLNQRLIAEGRAEVAALPSDARFGLWLTETEESAQVAKTGLWDGCDETETTPNAVWVDQATPESGSAATPESSHAE